MHMNPDPSNYYIKIKDKYDFELGTYMVFFTQFELKIRLQNLYFAFSLFLVHFTVIFINI